MVTPRRWAVPIIPGPIDETVTIEVDHMDRVRVVYTIGHEERVLPALDAATACMLGMAILDATRFCGELRDAADARRVAEMKRAGQRGPGFPVGPG